MEVIDQMVLIFGEAAVASHCRITAYKYRMRVGRKAGQPVEQDVAKALWYEAMADYLLGQGPDPREYRKGA
jgi:hypothetical protein